MENGKVMKENNKMCGKQFYVYVAYKILIRELAKARQISLGDVVKEVINTLPEPLRYVSDREAIQYKRKLDHVPNQEHYHKNDEGVEVIGVALTDNQYRKLLFWAMEDAVYPSDELCCLLQEQYPERLIQIYKEYELRGPIPRIIQENWVPYEDPKKRLTFDLDAKRKNKIFKFLEENKGMTLSNAVTMLISRYCTDKNSPFIKARKRNGATMEQQNVRLEKEVYESLKEIAKNNCVTKVSVIEYLIDNYCDALETLSYAA